MKTPSYRPPKLADDWTIFRPDCVQRDVCAVYRIQLMDPKDPLRTVLIPRFVDDDKEGILELGQTQNLLTKRWKFKQGVLKGNPADSEGFNLHYLHNKNKWLKETFGTLEDLYDHTRISYIPVQKRNLRAAERDLIDEYIGRFGEPPLTNGQVPGHQRPDICGEEPSVGRMPQKASPLKNLKLDWRLSAPVSPLHDKCVIYRIHLLRYEDPSRYCPIPRFEKVDPEGVLVIGFTIDFWRRWREFKAALGGSRRHGEGGLLHHAYDLSPRLRELVGPKKEITLRLIYSLVEVEPSQLVVGEYSAMNEYVKEFAELPPLNCQAPGKWRL
jgi:hypothetical protein